MKVRDLMTTEPKTVEDTATLGDAVAVMAKHRFREMPVVSNGELIGIITDRDIKMALGPEARGMDIDAIDADQLEGSVDWFMTPGVETIHPDADVAEACQRLLDLRIGALPVVEDGDVVGILSVTDIVRAAMKVL